MTDSDIAAHFFTHSPKRASRAKGNRRRLQNNRFQILRSDVLKTPFSQPPTGHDSQASATRSKGRTRLNKSFQTTSSESLTSLRAGRWLESIRKPQCPALSENPNFIFIRGAQNKSASLPPTPSSPWACLEALVSGTQPPVSTGVIL